MIETVLSEKIAQYAPADAIEQENVLVELMQHYVLVALARAGFFANAEFHGGTFLRIMHGLDRFSEDLDFALHDPDPSFSWRQALDAVAGYLVDEGIRFEVTDKSDAGSAVKKAFLKTDSIAKLLVLQLPFSRHPGRKIKIKLEIDSNPPAGADFETSYLTFPLLAAITTQTLESSFASKLHALLCRRYTKGRDWYDFLWYVSRGTRPTEALLANALRQYGPWAGEAIDVTPGWYLEQLDAVVRQIDWPLAAEDVRRFLPRRSQETLRLWSTELFVNQLQRLGRLVGGS